MSKTAFNVGDRVRYMHPGTRASGRPTVKVGSTGTVTEASGYAPRVQWDSGAAYIDGRRRPRTETYRHVADYLVHLESDAVQPPVEVPTFKVGDRVKYVQRDSFASVYDGELGTVTYATPHDVTVAWDRGAAAFLDGSHSYGPWTHSAPYLRPTPAPTKRAKVQLNGRTIKVTLTPIEAIALRDLLGQTSLGSGPNEPLHTLFKALAVVCPEPPGTCYPPSIRADIRWTPANIDNVTRRASDWMHSVGEDSSPLADKV